MSKNANVALSILAALFLGYLGYKGLTQGPAKMNSGAIFEAPVNYAVSEGKDAGGRTVYENCERRGQTAGWCVRSLHREDVVPFPVSSSQSGFVITYHSA